MYRTPGYGGLVGLFSSFVLPSIGSQLLTSVYTIADAYFMGKGAGAPGLTAIGLAYPFTVLINAAGAAVGIGGGALVSINRGSGDGEGAERVLGAMLFLAAFFSCFVTAFFKPVCAYLLSFYRVPAEVAAMADEYVRILFIGSASQIISMSFLGGVRNDGFPRKAMYILITSFAVNIFLDWLWVIAYPFGIAGGAWATVASQLFAAAMLFGHFLFRRSRVRLRARFIRFDPSLAGSILRMGVSPFGAQAAAALTMVLHNWQAIAYGGETGVTAYAVISYVTPVGVMLQEGVAEGVQPLISYYCGANLSGRKRLTARLGFIAAVIVGLACSALIYAASGVIPAFFSLRGAPARAAARGLALSVAAFPFLGIAKVGASYFQSIGKTAKAACLTYGDPLVFLPLYLWALPRVWGLDGVWLAVSFTNISLAALFVFLWRKERYCRVPFASIM